MSQRPTKFGQLLHRLAPPRSAASQNCGAFIASATEVAPAPAASKAPLWVVLHSINDLEVRLIHPRPVTASELAVQIRADGGEILRFTLSMAESQKRGELYESTAQLLQ